MPKGEEITTKFKVDISDLKKNISEAGKQIKLANATFKAATAGMDSWAKSADGISEKLKQLDSVLGAQKTKLSAYKEELARTEQAESENAKKAEELRRAYEQAVQQYGENSEEAKKFRSALGEVQKEQINNQKSAEDLRITILNQEGAVARTEAEINKYSSQLEEMEAAASRTATASEKLEDTIKQQETELAKLKKKYADVVLEQGKTSTEAQELAREIKELSGDLDDNRSRLGDAERAADELSGSLEDAGGSAETSSGGFTVLKGALANLLADGVKKLAGSLKELAQESQEANNSFQAQTGASAAEMDKFSESIKNVYKQNFGESMQDVAEAMAQVKQQTGEVDPSKLEELTINAIGLRDTFGMDVPESMRAVNQLMTQFGVTGEEAFNLIVQGTQNGLNKNDNLLDTINEYGPKFQMMGLSADEMFNMLANGAQSGVFDIDKLGDAMNEFSIRAIDGSDTTKQGFEAIGLDADEMAKKFSAGGESAKAAFQETLTALQATKDPLEQNAAAVNLFGTMWEDTGGKSILALGNLEGEISKTKGAMEEVNNVKYNDVGNSFAEIGRVLKMELLQPIVEQIEPKMRDFLGWLKTNIPQIKQALSDWLPIIAGIGAAIATYFVATKIIAFVNAIKSGTAAIKLMEIAQAALNVVMNLNPIGIVITAIAALVAAFVLLWNKSEAFRNFWIGLWEGIKSALSTAIDAIINFFTVTIPNDWNNFMTFCGTFITNIVTFFQQLPGKIWAFLTQVISNIGTWVSNMVAKAGEMGSQFLNAVVNFFTQLPNRIAYFIGFALGSVVKWVVNMTTKAKEVGTNFLTNVVTFFKQLPGKVWTFLTNAITNAAKFTVSMANKAREAGTNFLNNVINFIKNLPSRIWSLLTTAISNAGKFVSEMAAKAQDAGNKFTKNVINFIKNLPGNLWDLLVKAATKVIEWGSNLAKKGADAAKKLFDAVVDGVKSIPGKMLEIGKNIVDGVWNGIQNAAATFMQNVKDFFSNIVKGAKDALGIKSPSRVFRDEVGAQIVRGVSVGITRTAATAVQAIKELSNDMLTTAMNAGTSFKEAGSKAVSAFSQGVKKALDVMKTEINGLIEKNYKAYADNIDKKAQKNIDKKTKSIEDENKALKKQINKSNKEQINEQIKANNKKLQKYISDQKANAKKLKDEYKKSGSSVAKAFADAMSSELEKARVSISEKLTKIAEETQAAYDEIKKLQDDMNAKLAEHGDLFSYDDNGNLVLSDINAQTEAIEKYGQNLALLKGKISADLMEQITSMNVEDATAYTNALLSMSSEELKAYDDAYSRKVALAAEVSRNFYAQEVNKIKTEYAQKVTEAFKNVKDELYAAGQEAIKGFVEGMTKKGKKNAKKIKQLANKLAKEFSKALKINSPSKVFEQMGIYSGEGYEIGFVDSLEKAKKAISQALPTDLGGVAAGSRTVTTNKTYNFYQTNNSPKALSRLDIYRQTKNQLAFAKGV